MNNDKTNGELNIMLKNLEEKVEEKHNDVKEQLDRIEAQTVKTNGRVTELEKTKWMVYGAISILTALVLPLIFIILKNITF